MDQRRAASSCLGPCLYRGHGRARVRVRNGDTAVEALAETAAVVVAAATEGVGQLDGGTRRSGNQWAALGAD